MLASERSQLEQVLIEQCWRRYAEDEEAFYEECLKIPSQTDKRGFTEFGLYDHQRGDLGVLQDNRFVVILKARQLGLSTLVGAKALWTCLFRPGSVILWVSNNQENANKAVNMLEVMWSFLPQWVRDRAPELTRDQAGAKEWTFSNGITSRVRAFAGTRTATASETARIVILDEFALVDPHIQDDLLRSAKPTTDAGGSLWIISTARGGHNRFARTYLGAQREENGYVPIFHPWMVSHFVNPRAGRIKSCSACNGTALLRDESGKLITCPNCVSTTVYDTKLREFSDQPWKVHAEYPATDDEAFRESGNPVFRHLPDGDELFDQWVRGFMREEVDEITGRSLPVFVQEDTGPLRVRSDIVADGPDGWRHFVMYADPAQGIGGDYTAVHALCWDDDALPSIAAWWHSNETDAVMASREFDLLGRWLNNALLVVETTGGWGGAMLTELSVHSRYPNLYVYTPSDARRRKRGSKLGFEMSWQKRPMVIDRLIEYVKLDQETEDWKLAGIHPLLRQELGTFVRHENGRLEADVGMHDDLVMSLAGALWVLVEDVKATSPPTNEEVRPSLPELRLKNTWARIQAARAVEDRQNQKEMRRIERRIQTKRRTVERRRNRRGSAG